MEEPITQRELERALKRMAGKSGSGMDGIPPLLLKECGKQARQAIQDALNVILQSGSIPQSSKVPRIRLVLKEGTDKALPESYRPMTVTSAQYRLFSRILRAQLPTLGERTLMCWENSRMALGLAHVCRTTSLLFLRKERSLDLRAEIVMAFLEITKTYDSIEHKVPWMKLQE
ncbi:hypothetical protein HPB49_021676 [Dermacentor silvarum]|uniref:Uncharacterized protein n=1 Tax=Dermacentor silvarum TaxID=543639 RepID=A0ACB8CT59_DERSI|nr:hypothetical protein HPB49_021676 [Dermacentor silvarum]